MLDATGLDRDKLGGSDLPYDMMSAGKYTSVCLTYFFALVQSEAGDLGSVRNQFREQGHTLPRAARNQYFLVALFWLYRRRAIALAVSSIRPVAPWPE